jgi:hypothetical protein
MSEDLKSFDDGAMYYTDISDDTVHRITFDGPAVRPPTGKFNPIVP